MMKIIIVLLAASVVGCATPQPMGTRHISTRILDGTMGYHVTTPYEGLPEDGSAKKSAEEKLDYYSHNMCRHGYVKTGEQESYVTNKSGWWDLYGVKVKSLSWEIKCNNPPTQP